MKQSKLVTILLIVLMLGGWAVTLLGSDADEEYKEHIEAAEEYMERELYQKAIQEYEAAGAVQNSEQDCTAMLNAYEKRYEESTKTYSDYLKAVQRAVSTYGKNADYLITLAELYITDDNYDSAYKVLNKAVESGMEDENVEELLKKVKYAFKEDWVSYSDYRMASNGFYAVDANGTWTYIEEDGTDTNIGKLVMAGPVGQSGIRVIYDGEQGQLIDTDEVIQGKLDFVPIDAGCYAEGLIAVSDGNSYSYYNSLGDKQFGDYQQAGTFVDGQAAVQKDDKWFVINVRGDAVSEEYEEIVLHADGTYIKSGVMIAKREGSYRIYKDGNEVGEAYSDADIITDDGIVAVCKEGTWGFIDLEGKWVIEPQYEQAKSFSYGLAAVYDGKKWGFINTDGELVIDYLFRNADYFNSTGSCMIESVEDKWLLISLYIKAR